MAQWPTTEHSKPITLEPIVLNAPQELTSRVLQTLVPTHSIIAREPIQDVRDLRAGGWLLEPSVEAATESLENVSLSVPIDAIEAERQQYRQAWIASMGQCKSPKKKTSSIFDEDLSTTTNPIVAPRKHSFVPVPHSQSGTTYNLNREQFMPGISSSNTHQVAPSFGLDANVAAYNNSQPPYTNVPLQFPQEQLGWYNAPRLQVPNQAMNVQQQHFSPMGVHQSMPQVPSAAQHVPRASQSGPPGFVEPLQLKQSFPTQQQYSSAAYSVPLPPGLGLTYQSQSVPPGLTPTCPSTSVPPGLSPTYPSPGVSTIYHSRVTETNSMPNYAAQQQQKNALQHGPPPGMAHPPSNQGAGNHRSAIPAGNGLQAYQNNVQGGDPQNSRASSIELERQRLRAQWSGQ